MSLTSLPLFNPPVAPFVGSSGTSEVRAEQVELHSGHEQVLTRTIRPVRSHTLLWNDLEEEHVDYIQSFFDLLDGRGPFAWRPYDKVRSPTGRKPTLSEIVGGTMSVRTYYAGFTWWDSVEGETRLSGVASLQVGAGKLLRIRVPAVPYNVEGFRVYASETAGQERLQATVTDSRIWTQSAALDTGSAFPPSSSTLNPLAKWLRTSEVRVVPSTSLLRTVSVDIEEEVT